MNFHSLLRVDKSKKEAQKYLQVEEQIKKMITIILNNRNLKLAKLILNSDSKKPVLHIYLGSDYGFCANFNARLNEKIRAEKDIHKIIIGKKLKKNVDHVLLSLNNESLMDKYEELESIIREGILHKKYSKVEIIYNRYLNASNIELQENCLFPLTTQDSVEYIDDFVYEGDIQEILIHLISLYIMYQLVLCNISSHASENILRQESTSKSLKKIDELDEIYDMKERKIKKQKEFKKVLEIYTRLLTYNK